MTAPAAVPRGSVLRTRWWTLVARGAGTILLAVLALVVPERALFTLGIVAGSCAFADAIGAAVLATCVAGDGRRWGWLAFEAIASTALGAAVFLARGLTSAALVTAIAAWAVLAGVSELVGAVRLRPLVGGERVLAGISIVAMAAGAVALPFAGPGDAVYRWLVPAYALIFGALLIALGIGVNRWGRPVPAPSPRGTRTARRPPRAA
jgi:uncharacterized membrane protein HdeD (DUF308 family)